MKGSRIGARFALACAIGSAEAAVPEGPCSFPAGRGISFISATNVEDPQLPLGKLREALVRRQVSPPPLELLQVDEREPSTIPSQMAGLALEGRAAIVTLSGHIAKALSARGLASPTVFATIIDPVDWGIIDAAGPRRTNVAGITYDAQIEWKYLEHLRTAFPSVRRVGILADRYFFEKPVVRQVMTQSSAKLGLQAEAFVATSLEDLERVFTDPRAARVDAWVVPETPVVFRHEARVLELVGRRNVPNVFGHPSLLAKGALMVFGVEFAGMYDELAGILRMICEGTPARGIPLVRARHVFLGVSLANAKARGLRVDPRIIPLATTVD